MNEPSNFVDGQKDLGCLKNDNLNNPKYIPRYIEGSKLYSRTVCPSARHALGSHYDLHNLFGLFETIATNRALKKVRNKRPFIISRSTFPGQGHYGGHWTGDVLSTWKQMAVSVTGTYVHTYMLSI